MSDSARRRDRSSSPRGRRPAPSLEKIYRDLEAWARHRLLSGNGSSRDLPDAIRLPLQLELRLRGRGGDKLRRRFVDGTEKELSLLRERLELDALGFRLGHVFCHWCHSAICEHTRPDDERSVFTGYTATGQPVWQSFASWIVERRDPRVERLFLDRPVPLAVFTPGPELVRDLLADFGKRSGPYRIVGQVAAGFFRLPGRRRDPLANLAVTAHLIERRTPGGEPLYTLNLVSSPPAPHHLPTLVAERVSRVLSRFVDVLRKGERDIAQAIQESSQKGQRLPVKAARRLARETLEGAPAQLEKLLRRQSRRTDHAQDRTRDPERPTASALSDAQQAGADDLFLDREEDTIIVRGPRRRVHVYRRDGTHITSIVYPTETIKERLRIGRWAPLDAESTETLRAGLEERGSVPFAGDEEA